MGRGEKREEGERKGEVPRVFGQKVVCCCCPCCAGVVARCVDGSVDLRWCDRVLNASIVGFTRRRNSLALAKTEIIAFWVAGNGHLAEWRVGKLIKDGCEPTLLVCDVEDGQDIFGDTEDRVMLVEPRSDCDI